MHVIVTKTVYKQQEVSTWSPSLGARMRLGIVRRNVASEMSGNCMMAAVRQIWSVLGLISTPAKTRLNNNFGPVFNYVLICHGNSSGAV